MKVAGFISLLLLTSGESLKTDVIEFNGQENINVVLFQNC